MKKKIIIALIVVGTAAMAVNPILSDSFFSISRGYLLGVSSKTSNQEIKSTDIEISELQAMLKDYKQATHNNTLEHQLNEQEKRLAEQDRTIEDLTRKLEELSRRVK